MRFKNTSIFLLVLVVFDSCTITKNQVLIEPPIFLSDNSGDISIRYFKNHHTINSKNQIVEKDFVWDTIINDLKDSGKRSPLNTSVINYTAKKSFESFKVEIRNGYITQYRHQEYDNVKREYVITKIIEYRKGGLSGNFRITNFNDSILYQTTLKNGNGYWKDYHCEQSKLKTEGRITNNFKVGRWHYYNTQGNLDSTKVYTINDEVDVRCLYCLYNKYDPCY